ncbi:Mutant gag-pol polyprotein [Melia azedarach]|uniref:Mutant gag-pol polyprotein n=1 Tax=Melia azedarach TaxID=155640 RepID=A0ACC1XQ68_MELAZ|nr:Mutant gag-pol polyprotein [Melia azedarach]
MFIKTVNEQFIKLNTRLDDMQSSLLSKITGRCVLEEEEEEDSNLEESSSKRGKKVVSKRKSNLGSIKIKIPTFQGKNGPELYLEWERKVEHVFDCHIYFEEKKVKLTAMEFTDYASIWWDQLVINRHRNRERSIRSWEEMKLVMRKRFIPSHYYRDLHRKLQGLVQGSKNEIVEVVDLQHYVEMEELLHKAIKVEKQIKSKGFIFGSASSSSWKSNWKHNKAASKTKEKEKQKDSTTVFKVMIVLENREIKSASSSKDEMPPLEDSSDVEVEEPVHGDLLVTRRALSIQPKDDVDVE